jgi:hypothetical protein
MVVNPEISILNDAAPWARSSRGQGIRQSVPAGEL